MLIDTHCHIDHYPHPLDVIEQTKSRDIFVVAMTNLPSYFQQGIEYLEGQKKITQALGMHPLMIPKHENEFRIFEKLLQQTSWIGEIGADGSRQGKHTLKDQLIYLKRILQAAGRNKVFSLHSKGAETEVLSILRECDIEKAIFHWYSGDKATLKKIIESRYYFSINPVMCSSKSGMSIISAIPNDLILTESDGPFTSLNKTTCYPWDVIHVIKYIAQERKMSAEQAELQISNNFIKLCEGIQNCTIKHKDGVRYE